MLDQSEQDQLPSGVTLRCILQAHQQEVLRVAWSPYGQHLASVSLDNQVIVWDAETGKLLWTIRDPTPNDPLSRVNGLAWSPDGRTLAITHDNGNVRLWDLSTKKLQRTIDIYSKYYNSVWNRTRSDSIALEEVLSNPALDQNSGHRRKDDGTESAPQLKRNIRFNIIWSVAWSANGKFLALATDHNAIRLINTETGELRQRLEGHSDSVMSVIWSPDGHTLASGSRDTTIRLWNSETWELRQKLEGHSGYIASLAWSSEREVLASGSGDATVRIWNPVDGKLIAILEQHTGPIRSISFSANGQVLASKSQDGTVCLWHSDTWNLIACFPESASKYVLTTVTFHPQKPVLASLGEKDTVIRIWDINFADLLSTHTGQESVRYTTIKITLVGDSGVGKSALGWRLTHNEFKEQSSSHGEHFWIFDTLHSVQSDGTEQEVVLWDFAGQPDYRLVHALFLDDADIALVLFDSSNQQDPLKGTEYWLKALSQRENRPCRTILVGARIDRGEPPLTLAEIEAFWRHHRVTGGYVATSALTGTGLDMLMHHLADEIKQIEMPPTITTGTFRLIKDFMLELKEELELSEEPSQRNILVDLYTLRGLLENRYPNWTFTDSEMLTSIRHLTNHGYLRILRKSSGEEVILLAPNILNNLAASFVLEARRNPKGLGALQESQILRGQYDFPELTRLKNGEKEVLLDAATVLFLEHSICFRETLGRDTFLIFPALINQKKPLIEEFKTVDDISYTVSGSVENIYAALVVLLGHTNTFTRTNQWQNQAQYELEPEEICGFRQIAEREGEIDLILYYSENVSRYAKLLFQGLFERFLTGRNVKITSYLPIVCPACGDLQERSVVIKRIKDDKDFLHCTECAERISLIDSGDKGQLNIERNEQPHSQKEVWQKEVTFERASFEAMIVRRRTAFEAALTRLKGFLRDRGEVAKTPRCFISYAWSTPEYDHWVATLARDLQNSGIDIILDRRDNASIGLNIARFISLIETSDFIVVVATPLYRKKYENKVSETGSVVAAEVDLINLRLISTEEEKNTVLPLLRDGTPKSSLPPLMQGRVYSDFTFEENYFISLFDLILTLYSVPFEHPAIESLRELIK